MNASRIGAATALIAILVVAGIAVFPFYWMLTTATTATDTLFAASPQWLPDLTKLGNFAEAVRNTPMLLWLGNSAIVAVGTALLTIVLAVPTAYALSRFRFRGKLLIGLALFMTQMLPEAVLVVPLFSLFSSAHLINSLGGLILADTAFVMPVVALILKGAVDTVPTDLDEAARVDGVSRLGIMGRIVLPVIAPSVAAGTVIAFFHGWNEYIFALTFTTRDTLHTASVGLAGFIGELVTPTQQVMAVAIMYTLPAVVLYLLLQKFIVSGLAAGSVKG